MATCGCFQDCPNIQFCFLNLIPRNSTFNLLTLHMSRYILNYWFRKKNPLVFYTFVLAKCEFVTSDTLYLFLCMYVIVPGFQQTMPDIDQTLLALENLDRSSPDLWPEPSKYFFSLNSYILFSSFYILILCHQKHFYYYYQSCNRNNMSTPSWQFFLF